MSARAKGDGGLSSSDGSLRESCRSVLALKPVDGLILLCTLLALFSEDARLLTPPTADPPFHTFTAMVFVVFSLEFCCMLYISLGGGALRASWFQLALDCIATLSLIPDLWFIQQALSSEGDGGGSGGIGGEELCEVMRGGGQETLTLVRASRAARAGVKVGRLVKLTRLIRVAKIFGRCGKQRERLSESTSAGSAATASPGPEGLRQSVGEGGMGQQLAGLLTTKAVIVVLLMNFALPFLEKGAQDTLPAAGLGILSATPAAPLPGLAPPGGAAMVAAALGCPVGSELAGDAAWTLRGAAACDYAATAGGGWVATAVGVAGVLYTHPAQAQARLFARPENIACYSIDSDMDSEAVNRSDIDDVWGNLTVVSRAEWDGTAAAQLEASYSIGRTAFVVALLGLGSLLFARDARQLCQRITIPLSIISAEMRRITQLQQLEPGPPPQATLDGSGPGQGLSPIWEVREMQRSFGRMQAGLRSFVKFIPQMVVQNLLRAGEPTTVANIERRHVTVAFASIAEFDKVAQQLNSPVELMELLAEYFSVILSEIADAEGTLIEFVGDEILAVWNAPAPVSNHQVRAARCGLAMQRRVALLVQSSRWRGKGWPSLSVQVGLNTAEVFVGNLGAPDRMKYGVLGDGVNMAARTRSLNGRYGTNVLLTETTAHGDGGGGLRLRLLDVVAVKGKKIGIKVYECLGDCADGGHAAQDQTGGDHLNNAGKLPTPAAEIRQLLLESRYPAAMEAYLARRFQSAEEQLAKLQAELERRALRPDQAAALLRARCARFAASPPPLDWDGVDKVATKSF